MHGLLTTASKFCFAISIHRPEPGSGSSASDVPQWDLTRDSLFVAYYFRSGSLHSYGSPALYRYAFTPSAGIHASRLTLVTNRREAIEAAKYAQGDVITIQLGMKSASADWPLPKTNW